MGYYGGYCRPGGAVKINRDVVIPLLIFSAVFFGIDAGSPRPGNPAALPQTADAEVSGTLIDRFWQIVVDDRQSENKLSLVYFRKRLLTDFDLPLPVIKNTGLQSTKKIVIGLIDDTLIQNTILPEQSADSLKEQGYLLVISKKTVIIAGKDPAGLFYGMQTFFGAMEKRGNRSVCLPAMMRTAYPNIKIRAVHFSGVDTAAIERQLETMARLKLNAAILDTWLFYNLDNQDNRRLIGNIVRFARERFIDIIPELQSFGAPGGVLSKAPECAEGRWVENEPFRFAGDVAIPLKPASWSLQNVLSTGDTDVIIKNAQGKAYAEGKDYILKTSGRIEFPFLREIPSQIQRVSGGEIPDGGEVFVSYDQVFRLGSFDEGKIPYCPSESKTYEVMNASLKNIIELVGPGFISIGHDEIRGMNKDSRCKKRNMTNAQLFADEVGKLDAYAHSLDPDVRLLLWDDMVNPWHNGNNAAYQVPFGGVEGRIAPAIDLLSLDIFMMVWWYDADDWLEKMKNSFDYFGKKGFSCFGACFNNKKNIKDWFELIKKHEECKGLICTTWDGFDKNIEYITYFAGLAWSENE